MPGGCTRPVGEAVAAVGAALAAVAVGVGDDAANVAAGGPDDEQAEITTTRTAAIAVRTPAA
jgi:hypothetical protein